MQKSNKPFYDKFIKKNIDIKNKKKTNEGSTNLKPTEYKKKKSFKANKILSIEISKGKNDVQNVFRDLGKEEKKILNSFDKIAKKALGINSKQEIEMPKEIQKLFHELTDERGKRKLNYLNNPVKLSAYIYYYSWWNLVRACKLITKLDLDLNDGSVIADFGCGPFTMLCAFWIARPELREKKLSWYCVDISGKALSAGEKIFYQICEFTGVDKKNINWNITKITGKFGEKLNSFVDLFISANMFNEIFWDSTRKIPDEAERATNIISKYLNKKGSALVIEPGIPLAGEFIYYLRKTLLQKHFFISSPCPHAGLCSIPASSDKIFSTNNFIVAKNKWCHFSFFVNDAPENLLRLSQFVNLRKNRASLSFLYCRPFELLNKNLKNKLNSVAIKNGLCSNDSQTLDKQNYKDNQSDNEIFNARISSDIIQLPNGYIGRYACSSKGFILIVEKNYSTSKLKKYIEGSLLQIKTNKINFFFKDKKTGALLFEI